MRDPGALVVPDGKPLVWLGRRRGHLDTQRVYGADFMLALFEDTGATLRHFFYGGRPGVADRMVTNLVARFPYLQIAGTLSPAFSTDVAAPQADIDAINATRPDVLWVGLGHPKQDLWMHRNRGRVEAPVLAGVGAAFDFLSGDKKEAPQWMKRAGLQWLHRLASEPRRLWKRYLIGNAVFVALLIQEGELRRKRGA